MCFILKGNKTTKLKRRKRRRRQILMNICNENKSACSYIYFKFGEKEQEVKYVSFFFCFFFILFF